jgi:hypothetical protein
MDGMQGNNPVKDIRFEWQVGNITYRVQPSYSQPLAGFLQGGNGYIGAYSELVIL